MFLGAINPRPRKKPRKWLDLITILILCCTTLGYELPSDGLDGLGGTIANHNGVRCPWACNCGGQELNCGHRGLTQVPANLAGLPVTEKL